MSRKLLILFDSLHVWRPGRSRSRNKPDRFSNWQFEWAFSVQSAVDRSTLHTVFHKISAHWQRSKAGVMPVHGRWSWYPFYWYSEHDLNCHSRQYYTQWILLRAVVQPLLLTAFTSILEKCLQYLKNLIPSDYFAGDKSLLLSVKNEYSGKIYMNILWI